MLAFHRLFEGDTWEDERAYFSECTSCGWITMLEVIGALD